LEGCQSGKWPYENKFDQKDQEEKEMRGVNHGLTLVKILIKSGYLF